LDNAFSQLKSGAMGYTPNAGLPELRKAIVRHLGLDEACWERLVVTCGSAGALSSVMGAMLSTEDVVLTPDPSYPAYADLIRLYHGENRTVPLADAGPEFIKNLKKAACSKTKGLIINTPVNPTGQVFSHETLAEIQAWAAKNGIWVISDEVYRTLYAESPAPSFLDVSADGFVVGGLSKSISMTGFRLGWVMAPEHCVNAICQVHRLAVTCAPRLSQLLALQVLAQPEALQDPAMIYRKRRQAIRTQVENLGLKTVLPQGAFYLWLDLRDHTLETLKFCQNLHRETSVLAIPGEAFGDAGRGFVRLSYATPLKNFNEGLNRIQDHLELEKTS